MSGYTDDAISDYGALGAAFLEKPFTVDGPGPQGARGAEYPPERDPGHRLTRSLGAMS